MARKFLLLAGLAAACAVLTATAFAKTTGQEHYSGPDEFDITDCGFPLHAVGEFSGSVLFREAKDGEAFYVKDTYRFRDVVTNPDTGGWFVISGHAVFHEIRAEQVGENLYEFEAVEAGQPFVLTDSDGNVVVRDRGAIVHRAVFDTLGDGEPGGEIVEDLEPTVHGPHPGFAEDFDFCAYAADLTGVE